MQIIIRRDIFSDYPAEPGLWAMQAERDVPAKPNKGEFIEIADGWESVIVKDVTFMVDGRLIVTLDPMKTDSSDMLSDMQRLVSEYDWEWIGRRPLTS